MRSGYYYIRLTKEAVEKTAFVTDKGTDGMQPLPKKVAAIEALEPPKHIEECRQFLGLVSFYRKLIPFFVAVTECLNTMLRKGVVFTWMEQCINAFKLLWSELVKMPRLQNPNPNKHFKLFTDVFKHSYSGILHQEEMPDQPGAEVNLIPIAYFSGSFYRTQQLWNTTQKECYVVYQSIQKFAFYLAGTKCMLYCDHKPLAPFSPQACPVQCLIDGPWNFSNSTSSSSRYRERKMW